MLHAFASAHPISKTSLRVLQRLCRVSLLSLWVMRLFVLALFGTAWSLPAFGFCPSATTLPSARFASSSTFTFASLILINARLVNFALKWSSPLIKKCLPSGSVPTLAITSTVLTRVKLAIRARQFALCRSSVLSKSTNFSNLAPIGFETAHSAQPQSQARASGQCRLATRSLHSVLTGVRSWFATVADLTPRFLALITRFSLSSIVDLCAFFRFGVVLILGIGGNFGGWFVVRLKIGWIGLWSVGVIALTVWIVWAFVRSVGGVGGSWLLRGSAGVVRVCARRRFFGAVFRGFGGGNRLFELRGSCKLGWFGFVAVIVKQECSATEVLRSQQARCSGFSALVPYPF